MHLLDKIFLVFSRRPRPTSEPLVELTETFKVRVVMFCREVFNNERYDYGSENYYDFWKQIHKNLRILYGKMQLFEGNFSSQADDVTKFLQTCNTEEFFDFIEHIFRVECLFKVHMPQQEMVNEINYYLKVDDLPYYLTDYITRRGTGTLHGIEHETIEVSSYPQIICRGNQIVHDQAILPVLQLLQRKYFESANTEFLDALNEFRREDYGDCLTKCSSAFESVLKILCERKGWPYKQTDTSSTLVKTILTNTSLEDYFEQFLIILSTLRNRLSKSHGAGVSTKHVPQHLAQFAINLTASAILLIVHESGEK